MSWRGALVRRRRSPRRAAAGFTVLECLIAFAIIAALTLAMMDLTQASFRTAEGVERARVSAEAARSALARVGNEIPVAAGETELEDGEVTLTVVIAASETEASEFSEASAHQVTVTATHRDGGAPVVLRSVALGFASPFGE